MKQLTQQKEQEQELFENCKLNKSKCFPITNEI